MTGILNYDTGVTTDTTVPQEEEIPMTPPATREPELPVVSEDSCPPLPRSSSPDLITIDLPMTECGPISFTCRSSIFTFATPSSSASILPVHKLRGEMQAQQRRRRRLPRSPDMRSSSSGEP